MSQLAVPFHELDSLRIYLASRARQFSCPCLPQHQHTVLQNISGRMLPETCSKPEGILKVHALMPESGIPVEIFLSSGAYSDTTSLPDSSFPAKSVIFYGD
ncbi:hypothetical protein [Candidatus Electronema sp. TJ]|uniref:hypothetical protein n=1 Tax=Candidatus Electronema sp. TJ TaxID=3401573 RepID=UPI003AA96BDD